MPAIDLWHLSASILPHVRDPWPQSIGLGFPFTLSGASSILAGVVCAELPQPQRDRIVIRFGVYGSWIGALFHALALLVQLGYGP